VAAENRQVDNSPSDVEGEKRLTLCDMAASNPWMEPFDCVCRECWGDIRECCPNPGCAQCDGSPGCEITVCQFAGEM
jgi:hypothetical protein